MGAVVKLSEYPELSRKMKIPTKEEVADIMIERYKWPKEFANDMAEGFIDHYEARGWKYVGNIQMKSWRHAIGTWYRAFKYDNRYKSYMDKMEEMRKKQAMTPIEKLDMMLAAFPAMFPDNDTAVRVYDYLKKTGVFKIPGVVQNKIKEDAGNNRDRGKVMCVQYIFEQMIEQKQTFKDVL